MYFYTAYIKLIIVKGKCLPYNIIFYIVYVILRSDITYSHIPYSIVYIKTYIFFLFQIENKTKPEVFILQCVF
jgi:hypothetical protein